MMVEPTIKTVNTPSEAYLSKVGTPGTLEYREIFLIYREIFAKSDFFENFWSQIQKVRDSHARGESVYFPCRPW